MVQIRRLRELYWPVKRFLRAGFYVERNILLLKKASIQISESERNIERGLKTTADSMEKVQEIMKAIAENGGYYKGRRISVQQVEAYRKELVQTKISAQKQSEHLYTIKAYFEKTLETRIKLFNESCEHLDEVLYNIFFKGRFLAHGIWHRALEIFVFFR
ncbi:uncharacterized protein LOC131044932 isoform X2 [Cryptomeria japonica]|uniref:uncharacterized protein LOC131044932 isoform X2 n=1 Tax=Cryptomeria japonica TaxID=3369 RepID=UPI0025ABCF63|nr:uncharacterized protein LOC131044932 isoform X2 [Cryptomeria japonica]